METNNEVPVLPNDLMRMVFRECTDENRVSFGTSCKRFRMLNFDIGRRTFDEIVIILGKKWIDLQGMKSFRKATEYSVKQETAMVAFWSDHYKNLFRHAKTRVLDIKVTDLEAVSTVLQMLRTVTYDELRFKFDGNLDISDCVLSLIKDRKLDIATIDISWHGEVTPENAGRMRKIFLEFPKTYKLQLNQLFNSAAGNEVRDWINDENLIHFAANTTKLQIGINKCSAEGILRAFEYMSFVFSSRDYNQKSDTIFIDADKTVVDELFSMDHSKFEMNGSPGWRQLMHKRTGTIIYEHSLSVPRKVLVRDGAQMVETVENVEQWYLAIKHAYSC